VEGSLDGGTITAALELWSIFTGKAPPRIAGWLMLGLTLTMAAFLAWRKEWVAGDRGFIDITVPELYRLYRTGNTQIQSEAIIKPYVGRWVKARGRLDDVTRFSPLLYISIAGFDKDDWLRVTATKPFWRAKEFAVLPPETMLTVVGRLKDVSGPSIILTGVTSTKIEIPPKPPADH